jgi:putative transposase
MGRAYSVDLRERVVGAVCKGGLSCHQAAAQFGVGIGGYKPKKISGPHRDWLLQRCRKADFTLRGLVAELAERGLKVDYRTVWDFVHSEKLSHKKDADCCRAGPSRCGPPAGAMDQISEAD